MSMKKSGSGMWNAASPAGWRPSRSGMTEGRGRSCDRTAPRRAPRPLILGVGLACAALYGGCVHAPRPAPAPAAPVPVPPGAAGSDIPVVSVDLNRTVGENTVFRKTATDRQKFQVHI